MGRTKSEVITFRVDPETLERVKGKGIDEPNGWARELFEREAKTEDGLTSGERIILEAISRMSENVTRLETRMTQMEQRVGRKGKDEELSYGELMLYRELAAVTYLLASIAPGIVPKETWVKRMGEAYQGGKRGDILLASRRSNKNSQNGKH